MILNRTCLLLLNKKKIFFTFCFILKLFFYSKLAFAENLIYPVIGINKKIVTNIDIQNELEILSLSYNNINRTTLEKFAVKNLIESSIKNQELKKLNILLDSSIVTENLDKYFAELIRNKKINQENKQQNKKIKSLISKKIETELKWSKLIKILYLPELDLNFKEINDISISKNLKKKEKEKLILNETNKKFEKYSKSHFNKIKNNYLVKFYEK
jgi:hypothetical protein